MADTHPALASLPHPPQQAQQEQQHPHHVGCSTTNPSPLPVSSRALPQLSGNLSPGSHTIKRCSGRQELFTRENRDSRTNIDESGSLVTATRNRSPYSRSHSRSKSSNAVLFNLPVMTRPKSMPNTSTLVGTEPSPPTTTPDARSPAMTAARNASGAYPVRPSSPLHLDDRSLPYRTATPPAPSRSPAPRSFDLSPATLGGSTVQTIQEDSELSITPRAALASIPPPTASTAFARSSSLRRRPASPLHTLAVANAISGNPTSLANADNLPSTSDSPSLGPARYVNEAYPTLHHYASTSSFSSFSSVPSTPSSARSRSPSISSLDTIEDAPDLESEAIEAEHIERLKLAAERAERRERGEDIEQGGRRRSSLDVPRTGFGRTGRASNERKRWSICGGERRGDLDLETIWED